MQGKSARAKYVLDEAQKFLSTYLFVTKSNYSVFMKNAKLRIKQTQYKMDSTIARLKVDASNKEGSYEKIKKLLEDDETGRLKLHYDLDKTLGELQQMRSQYTKLVQTRKDAPNALPTFEEYLKLFESTSVILGKIRDMKQMDSFLRIFFSNFTITAIREGFSQGSSVSYKLKESWNGFLSANDFSLGARLLTHFKRLILVAWTHISFKVWPSSSIWLATYLPKDFSAIIFAASSKS